MEAAGFFAIACRVATCELVHVLKVISDNRSQPVGNPDKAMVSELITNRIETIYSIIESLQQLSRELAAIYSLPKEYFACLERWHFTWYERKTLQNLLIRWQALFPGKPVLEYMDKASNSHHFIQMLQEKLNNTAVLY